MAGASPGFALASALICTGQQYGLNRHNAIVLGQDKGRALPNRKGGIELEVLNLRGRPCRHRNVLDDDVIVAQLTTRVLARYHAGVLSVL